MFTETCQFFHYSKLSPMEVMHHVHDNQHEELSREYDDLMDPGRTDSILRLLDKDSFSAKHILSSLFMVGFVYHIQ